MKLSNESRANDRDDCDTCEGVEDHLGQLERTFKASPSQTCLNAIGGSPPLKTACKYVAGPEENGASQQQDQLHEHLVACDRGSAGAREMLEESYEGPVVEQEQQRPEQA